MLGVPMCEICNERTAKYVCQRCGALVCEYHYYPHLMICSRCVSEEVPEYSSRSRPSFNIMDKFMMVGLLWILGMFLIAIGFVLMSSLGVRGEGGVVIFPFPFVVHANPLVFLTIFLVFIAIVIMLMIYFMFKVAG